MSLIEILTEYGLDTLITAITTLIITGIIKIPIKNISQKFSNAKKITRFITFLPVIIGFGATAVFFVIFKDGIMFTQEFYVQWLTTVSLSMAIYAFWEKFVPSEKKILSDADIQANKELLEQLEIRLTTKSEQNVEKQTVEQRQISTNEIQQKNRKKIILTNKKEKNNGDIEIEQKDN